MAGRGDDWLADGAGGDWQDGDWNDDEFRRVGYAFVDLMAEYLQGLEGRRVYGPVSPAGLDDLFAEDLPEEGATSADLLTECRAKIFPNSMAIGSRRYFGMMNPAPLPVAVFADALASAMNQNAASWRNAPAATAVEKRVIRWLCALFGLGDAAFGTLVPGGSFANITGLKLAMNRSLGRNLETWDPEESPHLAATAQLRFYVSKQAHYSFRKAIDLLGLGHGQLRKIPVDGLFRVDLAALEAALLADRAAGLVPCCVIGIAGTTNTGSIDKLDKLADLAAAHGCWYHVDAAYGGAVMLSEKYRPMLRGIERADSITVDPHKWFYVPFEAGGILVRDGDLLRETFLVRPEYYMERRGDGVAAPRPPQLPHGGAGQLLPVRPARQPPLQRAEAVAGDEERGPPPLRGLGGEGHRAGPGPGRPAAARARVPPDRAQHPGDLHLPLGAQRRLAHAGAGRPAQPRPAGTGRARGRRLVQPHHPERARGPARQLREPPDAPRGRAAPAVGAAPRGRPAATLNPRRPS